MPPGISSVLLIGCGAVGSVVSTHLCAGDAIDQLVLADVDGRRAKSVAHEMGSDKARALRLDAADPKALRKAMEACGLVVNASLPRFNAGIKEAALDRGLHYLDLAAESVDPFKDDDRWRDAGLTAILSMGEDPGISNVFVRHAAEGMDHVDSVRIRDGDSATSREFAFISLFSPETFIEETLMPPRIWEDGAYTTLPPLGARETFEFPAPVGRRSVYSVDHEEVDSLPHCLGKPVGHVDFKLALDAATVRRLKEYRDARDRAATPADRDAVRTAFLSSIPRAADLAGRVDGYASLVVIVSGRTRGTGKTDTLAVTLGHRKAARRYGTTATAYLAGTGAAIGALLLARGTIRRTGALEPEVLDPAPFFPMLLERGIEVRESLRPAREP